MAGIAVNTTLFPASYAVNIGSIAAADERSAPYDTFKLARSFRPPIAPDAAAFTIRLKVGHSI